MLFDIKLEGLDELEKAVNAINKELDKNRGKLLLSCAGEVRDAIRNKAPVGPTGNLKAAAYANLSPDKNVAFAGIRPKRAPHAHLVEYGTSGARRAKKSKVLVSKYGEFFGPVVAPMPAHPFVRPAWDEKKEGIKRKIREGLKDIILKPL
jgi:HK97 gp10 family phage protein